MKTYLTWKNSKYSLYHFFFSFRRLPVYLWAAKWWYVKIQASLFLNAHQVSDALALTVPPACSKLCSEILKCLKHQYWDKWTWDFKSCSCSLYWMERQKHAATFDPQQYLRTRTVIQVTPSGQILSRSLSKMDFWLDIQPAIHVGSFQIWASRTVTEIL